MNAHRFLTIPLAFPASNKKPLFSLGRVLIAFIGLLAVDLSAPMTAQAASYTWDPSLTPSTPSGGNGIWDAATTSNWANGGADAQWANAGADTAVFAGSAGTVTLSGSLSALGVQFRTAGYTLSSGTLAIGTSGIDASALSSGTTTIGSSLVLGGAQSWNVGSGAALSASGVISGTSALTKTGAGVLILGGVNTYSGNTAVNAGTLSLTGSLSSSTLSMGGGTFSFDAAGTNTQTFGTTSIASGVSYIKNNVSTDTLALGALSSSGGFVLLTKTGNISTTTTTFIRQLIANSYNLGGWIAIDNGNNTYDWANSGTSGTNNISAVTYASGGTSNAGNVRYTSGNTSFNVNGSWASINLQGASTTLNINGTQVYVDTGGIILSGGATLAGSKPVKANGGVFYVPVPDSGTISTSLQDNGTTALYKEGPGTLTLSGANSFTGGTVLYGGTIFLNSSGALASSGAISFAGGTLKYGSNNTTDYSSRFSTGAGQAYSVDTNGQSVTWATALTSSGGTLTKLGSGTLVLSGVNTFSGATAINSGTLKLTGALNISGAVSLGAGTLVGTGTAGLVSVNSASAMITNGSGGADTTKLTLAGLTFNSAGSILLNQGSSQTTPALVVTGGLVSTPGIQLNFSTAPAWGNGTYDLISYGSFTGNTSDFTLGAITLGGRSSAVLGNTGASNGYITLTIAGDSPYWTGAASNVWTTGTSFSNWSLITQGTPTTFLTGDQVTFNDNATGSTTVDISGSNVGVSSVVFNNNSKTYTIGSSSGAGIADSGTAAHASVTLNGTGLVVLTATNSYTGATTINSGTLQLGDGTTDGDISTTSAIANNSSLIFNRVGSLTYSGVISGTGSVTKTGLGTQVLTGANTYSGATTLNSGTLQVGNGGTGSLGTSAVTVGAGTVLAVNLASGALSNGITNNGLVSLAGSGNNTLSGAIANSGTIALNSTGANTLSGVISGTGALVANGTGTTTVSGANTYSGNTFLNAGTVSVGSSSNPLGTGTINLNGGTLSNYQGSTINNTIVVGSSGGTIGIGADADFSLGGTLSGSGNLRFTASSFVRSINMNLTSNNMTGGTITSDNGNSVFRLNSYGASNSSVDWVLNNNTSSRGNMIGVTSSGTFSFGSLAGSGLLQGNFQSSSIQVNLSIGGNNNSATFSGIIQNNGPTISVTKVGNGTETFSGNNSYSGGTNLASGTLAFGNNNAFGSGAVTLNGGTLKSTGGYTLPNAINVNTASVLDMAGNNTGLSGNLTGSAALTLNNSGNASTLTLSGNNASFSGTFTAGNNNAMSFTSANAGSANAAWVFNDSSLDRVRVSVSGTNTLSFGAISGSGQIQNDTAASLTTLSIGGLNTSTTFDGTIKDNTGIMALTKVGTGSLTLTGNSNYTGATNVNSGKLVVSGALSGATSTTVAVGATLASGNNTTSSIAGLVTVNSDNTGGGTLAVGDTNGNSTSIGKLSVTGSVTLGTSSTTGLAHLAMELGGTTAGTGYDQLSVSGAVNLSNVSLDLTLAGYTANSHNGEFDGAGNLVSLGDTFFLVLSGAPVTGTFANQTAPNYSGSYSTIAVGDQLFAINYASDGVSFNSTGGNDIALMAVPEPGTWAMMLSGLGMLSFWQRSRRKAV